ncbi:MAG: SpoIID/LytB domain-containing protein [Planctomycetota bacterium]|nr:SpoIID/LytB domain-containing protein [Planctomycetaceae bacterium]MDQ3330142.1 SpoIID/LytB domain-containing protein [Planctomycetota bacterium]
MDGLAQTSRGVLGSAILLLIVGVIVVWSLDDAAPTKPDAPPSMTAVSSSRSADGDDAIRVALTRRSVSSIRLRIDGSYRLVPLDGREGPVAVPEPLSDRSLEVDPRGIDIAGRRFGGSGVEVVPDSSPAVWIDGRKYRGSVRLHLTSEGGMRAVNVVPLEEYVAAVVDAEMPGHFPTAAREAQAIVARGYAVSCRRQPPHEWFDLYSTPVSQNYLGVIYEGREGRLLAGETAGGRAAAASTESLVCTFDGELFRTYYSACCGGRTFAGDVVFDDGTGSLPSVACGGCDDAPLFRWERSIASDAALERLSELARARMPAFRSIASAKTIGGVSVPAVVAISDGRRTVRLPAVEVRSAIGLPSLCFQLTGDGRRIDVAGRGHGHGVGLCQWGAKGLAERGLSCREILQHYYPGCELTLLSASTAR